MWGDGKPRYGGRPMYARTQRNLGPGPQIPAYVRQIPQGMPPDYFGQTELGQGIWRENQNRLPSNTSVIKTQVPMIWRVHDLEVPVSQGNFGPVVKYRWQRPLVIVQMKLMVTSGQADDLAALELFWEDGEGDQVPTSGFLPLSVCGSAISKNGHWLQMEQPVLHNKVMTFQVQNRSRLEGTITPILLFQCVERDVMLTAVP